MPIRFKTTALFILSMICFFVGCQDSAQEQTDIMEEGVSLLLAKQRAQSIEQLNYELYFNIPVGIDEAIKGSNQIRFVLLDASQDLQLDFKEKADHLDSVQVNEQWIPTKIDNEHILIPHQFLQEGENSIALYFTAGNLSLNRNEDYLYTLLVPDRARTVFPVFDQPNLKAKFHLSLNVPSGWSALSNGLLKDSLVLADRTQYVFQASDEISTYLFSFAAGKFQQIKATVGNVDMSMFHRETDTAKIAASQQEIFQIHADALQFMEAYTGIPYPFQKFDFIAIPGFQYGGMEHVGAIDYKASSLFLDPSATQKQQIRRASLIAHETAHMWFGDLVTMDWFNDVWMKEVFANFMADKITEMRMGRSNYDLKFLQDHYPAAYGVDRTAGANPIRQELANLKDAGSLYGSIIYHKAPIMMRQLELLMGKEAFQRGLQSYLKQYAYSNASWPQLIDILNAQTSVDLLSWNQVWVNQAGMPNFEYQLNPQNDGSTVLNIQQLDPLGKGRVWPQVFDVLLDYGSSTKSLQIPMDDEAISINLPQNELTLEAIYFNTNGLGYGLFPMDSRVLEMPKRVYELNPAVKRASFYVHAYENMLAGRELTPLALYQFLLNGISLEQEELNLNLLTNYISNIYWRFLNESERNPEQLEALLWQEMLNRKAVNEQKILFNTFISIAQSEKAATHIYQIWKEQQPPANISLSNSDYTDLALALAVRDYDEDIIQKQIARIENPDRKKRLAFMAGAVSSEEANRTSFFESLKQEENRAKEAWVVDALSYLHHPLRIESSRQYLVESLNLLEEIQATGDIFFPFRWLEATFQAYHSDEAIAIVNDFLTEHPDYNPMLKAKILQATDDLFRAHKLRNKN